MKNILQPVQPNPQGNPTNHADYLFWCPGCESYHGVWVTKPNAIGAKWQFNGDLEKPTLSPSILIRFKDAHGKDKCCHLFMRSGELQFLSDCTHALAGKTVAMEEF